MLHNNLTERLPCGERRATSTRCELLNIDAAPNKSHMHCMSQNEEWVLCRAIRISERRATTRSGVINGMPGIVIVENSPYGLAATKNVHESFIKDSEFALGEFINAKHDDTVCASLDPDVPRR